MAKLKFCAGVSERKIADKTSMSPHLVRRHLDRIKAQMTLMNRMRRAAMLQGSLGVHKNLAESFASYKSDSPT